MGHGSTLAGLLASRKLLFVTGKGGIGKSLISAALAQSAAAAGRRVLLVESSSRDQLAPLFGVAPVGHVETDLAPGIRCINLNSAGNFREYVTKYLGQQRLFDSVLSHRVVQSFFNTIPGLAEAMMLGRLYYTCDVRDNEERPDLVIFDSPASGHFLSLMTTPDAILGSGLAGPMLKDTERVRDFLRRSNDVGVLYVCTPEPLVISEAVEFLPEIQRQSPAKIDGVIVNRIPPDFDGQPIVFEDSSAGQQLIEFLRARAGKSQVALAELKKAIDSGLLGRSGKKDIASESKAGGSEPVVIGLRDQGFVDDPLTGDFFKSFLIDELVNA